MCLMKTELGIELDAHYLNLIHSGMDPSEIVSWIDDYLNSVVDFRDDEQQVNDVNFIVAAAKVQYYRHMNENAVKDLVNIAQIGKKMNTKAEVEAHLARIGVLSSATGPSEGAGCAQGFCISDSKEDSVVQLPDSQNQAPKHVAPVRGPAADNKSLKKKSSVKSLGNRNKAVKSGAAALVTANAASGKEVSACQPREHRISIVNGLTGSLAVTSGKRTISPCPMPMSASDTVVASPFVLPGSLPLPADDVIADVAAANVKGTAYMIPKRKKQKFD